MTDVDALKISIVMPTLNQRRFIEQSVRSVLDQVGGFHLELIVVDGVSTDGTVEFLRSVDDPRLSWTSGRDGGQSEAINRGLARASGAVVAWLNSDDLYLPGALATVAGVFSKEPGTQWAVGRCLIIDDTGVEVRRRVTAYKDRALRRFSTRKLLRENMISQPAVFWRRSFGQRVGALDESLHYTMDYDLWLRMARLAPPRLIDRALSAFRLHAQSKSGQVNRRQFDEQYAVARRYFDGDRTSRIIHRLNVEKIVWAYRVMRLLDR